MKNRFTIKPICLASVLSLSLVSLAGEHGAHVHGAAKLDVAIDGNTVTLMLESPMDSLAGFEHHASSDKDKATLKTLREKLDDAGTLFVFSSEANCRLQSAKVESPLFGEKGNDHSHEEKKGHDDKHDHDEKHDHEEGTHSDLDGEFVFQCTSPDKLDALTVNLFDIAANLQDLDVSLAGPRGQKAAELNGKSRLIRW